MQKNTLILLRHGKSDWRINTDDRHRPLKPRGKQGAERIGTWLFQQNLIPDYILSSPAERALDTATRACKAMGLPGKAIVTDARIYHNTSEDLLHALADCPAEKQRIMLVGHNPSLEVLLEELVDAPLSWPDDGKLLPTATLAWLRIAADWRDLRAHCATLEQIIRAKMLPK